MEWQGGNIMDINEVKKIVEMMPQVFDSHEFILKYIWEYASSYGNLIVKHRNVTTAHAEVGKFLLNKANELGIEKIGEKDSKDFFGNTAPCAQWKKVK